MIGTLFDPPPPPRRNRYVEPPARTRRPGVRRTAHDTEVAADAAAHPRRGGQQWHVLTVAAGLGEFTDADLTARIATMKPGSVIKRRGELTDAGLIAKTSRRRKVDGSSRVVWTITDAGRETAARWGER